MAILWTIALFAGSFALYFALGTTLRIVYYPWTEASMDEPARRLQKPWESIATFAGLMSFFHWRTPAAIYIHGFDKGIETVWFNNPDGTLVLYKIVWAGFAVVFAVKLFWDLSE